MANKYLEKIAFDWLHEVNSDEKIGWTGEIQPMHEKDYRWATNHPDHMYGGRPLGDPRNRSKGSYVFRTGNDLNVQLQSSKFDPHGRKLSAIFSLKGRGHTEGYPSPEEFNKHVEHAHIAWPAGASEASREEVKRQYKEHFEDYVLRDRETNKAVEKNQVKKTVSTVKNNPIKEVVEKKKWPLGKKLLVGGGVAAGLGAGAYYLANKHD